MAEKTSCTPFGSIDHCPPTCPGLLDSQLVAGYGESILVQVCPNPDTLGSSPSETDFCGSSPDQIIVYSDTVPSDSEYENMAKNFGQ
ncbi:hypothetical protein KBD20_00805 [Candidatus Saccharibacteria bacterium]|nr:hypothetical protein [Candidatus Saccharibacteria bacterium]